MRAKPTSPKLLSGGNPQIPKGDGDEPVQAYIEAMPGWKREGYGKFAFSLRDTLEMLRFPGWWKLTGRHAGTGLRELWHSAWKRGYLGRVRRYCPKLGLDDLLPHPAGVRAQAVARDGTMIHNFLVENTARSLHAGNAPSPAPTSALPIARHLCDLFLDD